MNIKDLLLKLKRTAYAVWLVLLLSVVGMTNVNAQSVSGLDIEIGDDSSTNGFLPYYTLYNYTLTQQIYTVDEIGLAGAITALKFNYTGNQTSDLTNTIDVYIKHTSKSVFEDGNDWESIEPGDLHYSGTFLIDAEPGWKQIVLDTPFEYNGVDNLLICFDNNTGSWTSTRQWYTYSTDENRAMYVRSDDTNYDPFNAAQYGGTMQTVNNHIILEMLNENYTFISASINPVGTGTVNGVGVYQLGETCTLTALPNPGCTFLNWSENGEVVSTEPELSFTVTGNRTLVANFQYPTFLADDFNDGEINSELWTWNGSSVYETDGLMKIEQNNTDENVYLLSAPLSLTPDNQIIIERKFKLHRANEYYYGENTVMLNGSENSYIRVQYFYDSYDGRYGTYMVSQLDGQYTEIYLCDAQFDIWLTEKIVINFTDGTLAYYLGGNLVSIVDVPYLTEQQIIYYNLKFRPYGWWTGHHQYMDYIAINPGPTTLVAIPNPIEMGYRPGGAWMRPLTVSIDNLGAGTMINSLSSTNGFFVIEETPDLPVSLAYGDSFSFDISTTTGIGVINANLLVGYGDDEQAQFPLSATAYNPISPDVWELAQQVSSFPYTATLNSATHPLYDNYVLPPTDIANGADAVYKLVFSEDTYLNASVTNGENGKVALYPEGFKGMGGPDLENNYTGPEMAIEEWLHYDNGEYYTSWCSGYETMDWGILIPTEQLISYDGCSLRKVAMYDTEYNYGTVTIKIYQGGETPALGTLVHVQSFEPFGNYTFHEVNLIPTIIIDGTQNLWITMHYEGYNGYPAAACVDTGNPNGRWFSYDGGTTWWDHNEIEQYSYSTWMIRGYVTTSTGRTVALNDRSEVQNLTVTPGTYYLAASSTSDEWTVEINAGEVPCPEIAYNPMPADNATEVAPSNLTLSWHLGERTTSYRLLLGTDPNNMDPLVDWTRDLMNHYNVSGLHNNTVYYWRIDQRNDGCMEGVTGDLWSFTTHLNTPGYLWADHDYMFEGEWNALYWDTPAERGLLSYNVYQDGNLIGNTTETYFDISNLTYNMYGYQFNVTAVYDEGESNYSYGYWVWVSGYGSVEGHVYEQDGVTPIANVRVSLAGYDEFGWYRNVYFTTDAEGYYSGSLYVGNYNVTASCAGYQTKYYGMVYVPHNETISGIDFMLDESFTPVGEVVAEYYPDANNPESPYVKVYWSMTSNHIEDFETGDFSMFEWQLDDYYPWQITTNNPYEGSYCMRSNNNYYDYTTSWMQVTVNIPYDCYISFNGRISSEDWFDYGHFYIDGNEQGNWSGETDWFEVSYSVTAGTHDFAWSYSKDGSVSSGDDCFYVDNINFANVEATRSFQHYRVYRTDEYNNGPYTDANTIILSDATNDTLFIDTTWPDVEMGSYKYGVSCVYEGNRESEISWGDLKQFQPVLNCVSRQKQMPNGKLCGDNRDVILSEGFENGMPEGWSIIDNNYDGYTWTTLDNVWSYYSGLTLDWYHSGSNAIVSGSYINGVGSLSPDEYLITPQVVLTPGSQLSFWVAATDVNYPADHFGVFVSNTGTNPNDFTLVEEWTLTAKKEGKSGIARESRDGKGLRIGSWYNYIVDLSAYSGYAYIAFRHFNCYDQYILAIDDVELSTTSSLIQDPRESAIRWSNGIDKDMLLSGVNLTVTLNSGDSPEGTLVSFYNLNESEQTHHPMADLILDGSGYFAWDWFRKGDYQVTITKDGYETVTDYVSVYEPTDLQYQLEEIMANISDLYVSRTGWAIWNGPGNDGLVFPSSYAFEFGFEENLEGWTVLTVNIDGGKWLHSNNNPSGYDYASHAHGGNGFAMCYSYVDYVGAYNTDSYLISPKKYRITNGSTLTFWADNANDSYPESFSVCLATVDNPSPSDFMTIWSGSAKANGSPKANVRHNDTRYDNWRFHSIDLSAYAGQIVWIAFHDVDYDMYEVWIDDVELTPRGNGGRHLESIQVVLSDLNGNIIYTGETENNYMQLPVESLVEGQTYHLAVGSVYSSGLSNWDETNWMYEPCDNYEGVTNLYGQTIDEGVLLTWAEMDSILGVAIFRDGEWVGFASGNNYLDRGSSREHDYEVRVVYDGEFICPNENTYLSMSCPQSVEVLGFLVTQTSFFAEGWTWWSTYVNQELIDGLNLLEESLGANGMQIKSQTQFVQNIDNTWVGSLNNIDNESTYLVQVSAPCSVSYTSERVEPEEHPITLNNGWNWAGYPSAMAMSINNALVNHVPAEGDFLKSQTSCAIYYPALGWIGTLKTLLPGMGLMYLSNNSQAVTFTYNRGAKTDGIENNITAEENYWQPNVQAYPNNMTIMAVVELDDTEIQSEDFELVVFANGECRGSAKLMFVEALNRYIAFLTVYGDEVAELNFSLYDATTGMTTFNSDESLIFSTNTIVGEPMSPYVVRFRSTTGLDEGNTSVNIFPNPVEKGSLFSIGLPDDGNKVQIEIVNALGVVERLNALSLQTSATLRAPEAVGVYTLRITVEGKGTYIRKLIVR